MASFPCLTSIHTTHGHLRRRWSGLALASLVSVLAGCGGGGDDGGVEDGSGNQPQPSVFTVLTGTPAEGTTDVERNGVMAVKFSGEAAPSTVNDLNVKLIGPEGNTIATTLTVNGTELQLVPGAPGLPGDSTYTLQVSSSVTDIAGHALGLPFWRSFITAPQHWGAKATTIDTLADFDPEARPNVVADTKGNVIAVWHRPVGDADTVFAARLDGKTGQWGAPATVYTARSSAFMNSFKLIAGPGGDAYLCWTEYDFGRASIRLARYAAATGAWVEPVTPFAVEFGFEPLVGIPAVDTKGNITLVTSTYSQLFATRFDAAQMVWSSPQAIEHLVVGDALSNQKLLVDDKGNLTAAWVQGGDDLQAAIYSARYDVTAGVWSDAVPVASRPLTGSFDAFSMGMDGDGVITMAWAHDFGGGVPPGIEASRFDRAADGWSAPARLDRAGTDPLGASRPALAVDACGHATVVWLQNGGLYSSRLRAKSVSWSAPREVTPDGMDGGAGNLSVTADVVGNVVVVFVPASTQRATAIQYKVRSGQWHRPVTIDTPASGVAVTSNAPVTAVDSSGDVTAVWFGQTDVDGVVQTVLEANQFR
jgi:hypothetical protein